METLELLGISPLWMFAFPLVVVVGYAVVLVSAYKAAKAAAKKNRPVAETKHYDFDA